MILRATPMVFGLFLLWFSTTMSIFDPVHDLSVMLGLMLGIIVGPALILTTGSK